MNIVIVGLGNVGEKVLEICRQKQLHVKATVSPHNANASHKNLNDVVLEKDDVIIDFSHPQCVLANMKIYAENNCRVIMGTAGWESEKKEVEKIVADSKIQFFTSHNFMKRVRNFWGNLELLLSSGEYLHAEVREIRVQGASKEYSSTAFHTAKIIAKMLEKSAQRKTAGDNFSDTNIVFLESAPDGKHHLDIKVSLFSVEGKLDLHFIIEDADEANWQYAKGAVSLIQDFTE